MYRTPPAFVPARRSVLLAAILIWLSLGRAYAQMAPKREFRGAWIATVANIDWPSRPGLSSGQQQQEYIRLLDTLQNLGINAVIVQIRPSADAFYISSIEPWSYWLSGKQGQPPMPYYDPLRFMIHQAHLHGMEFHAWLNPYRAVFDMHSRLSADNITRIHPDWFVTYGDRKYFNPGVPAVWTYLTNLVRDIVSRYNVDGIHFDDYFYPYRLAGRAFPDYQTYMRYGRPEGLGLEDWRRHNVDTVIELVSKAIKQVKPWVKFGISPFGVYRNEREDPDGSNTLAGQTDYDDLYADVLLWLKKGWIDYVAPQLYWEFGNRAAPYEILLDWWNRHTFGRALYIGQGLYRIGSSPAWRDPRQLPDQLMANRTEPHVEGSIFYSASVFNRYLLGFQDSLKEHFYRYPALIPTMPWIDSIPPPAPASLQARRGPSGVWLSWKDRDSSGQTTQFVVYRFSADQPLHFQDPSHILAILNRNPGQPVQGFLDSSYRAAQRVVYAVTALDRLHNESSPSQTAQVPRMEPLLLPLMETRP